jgi:hypothetical protein
MRPRPTLRSVAAGVAKAASIAAGEYALYASVTWLRYGRPRRPRGDEQDPLLDRFMPAYDVVERHHIRVAAPAEITIATAREMDLRRPAVVRAIIRTRELLLGAERADAATPRGILDQTQAMGWVILADTPGREVVVGAVTKPWEPHVTFRSVPPADFAGFAEPGYVKIVWTLRADPAGDDSSIFRTETRAIATDAGARRKFRRYWSVLSPGIIAIRLAMLLPLKADAERRARSLARTA